MLVQAIFTTAGFRKPFFLTWVANSLFVVTLPLRALLLAVRRQFKGTQRATTEATVPAERPAAPEAPRPIVSAEVRAAAKAGLLVAPIWFAANATYNYSMSMTSITSTTVVSSSSAAFTLLLSVAVLHERVSVLKVLGVALCWLGNGLTVMSDQSAAMPGNASHANANPWGA